MFWITDSSTNEADTEYLSVRPLKIIETMLPNSQNLVVIEPETVTEELLKWSLSRQRYTLWLNVPVDFKLPEKHLVVVLDDIDSNKFMNILSKMYAQTVFSFLYKYDINIAISKYQQLHVFTDEKIGRIQAETWLYGIYLPSNKENLILEQLEESVKRIKQQASISELQLGWEDFSDVNLFMVFR